MQNKIAKNIENIFLGDLSFMTVINGIHKVMVKYGVRSSKFFGLHVHSCSHWLRPSPIPRIWAHKRGRYWSAKIDRISFGPPA
jgi:hypothetical protein